jgi:hypothetical protein
MTEPLVSQVIKSPNRYLRAVKTYIDLISRDVPLVYGSGLKRLYALSSGVATLNDEQIEGIAAKSEALNLIDYNPNHFMMKCIFKNISLYGQELKRMINARIISISNGDVRNPDPAVKFSADEARRFYYLPPASFIKRLQKVLADRVDAKYITTHVGPSFSEVCNDAVFLQSRMQLQEGHMSPNESSWGALMNVVEGLADLLESEAKYVLVDDNYKDVARPALTIMLFIGKALMGDLTDAPLRKDINLVDLEGKLNLTDGTLASVPFPLRQTVSVFADNDHHGVSLKGRDYLSAVSSAAFYRSSEDEGQD